jgi:hypothetical protein
VGLPAQVVPMYIGAPLSHHHRAYEHVRGGLSNWHCRTA